MQSQIEMFGAGRSHPKESPLKSDETSRRIGSALSMAIMLAILSIGPPWAILAFVDPLIGKFLAGIWVGSIWLGAVLASWCWKGKDL